MVYALSILEEYTMKRIFVFATILALMITQEVSASGFSVAPLTVISGPSPFAGCPNIGGLGNPPGINYVNAEEEPWVAVNPTNSNNIIAVWQQDRWSNGGARGLVAGVSHDGGLTWNETYAHFSFCSGGTVANGGDFERASDPWVTFSPNGHAYQISLSASSDLLTSAILVSKSTNGGDTWSEPATIIRETTPFHFNDKESITADPTDSNFVYAVWDRSRKPGENASFNALHSFAFRGDAMFSRTKDGGTSWEAPRSILPTNANQFTIGNQIVVLPDGTLVDVFGLGRGSGVQPSVNPFTHSLVRSTDQGLTWSRVIDISTDKALGARDPDTGRPIRAEGGIPEIAVDPDNGNLYVVWQDSRFSGVDEIAFSMSTDGGFTWTAPIKINQTPRSDTAANQQAFVPHIRVAADGMVGVTYYDFRNNDANPGVPTDYWIVHCHSDCPDAANWGDEARLSTTSFDIEQAPAARGPFGFFLGEYEGLANIGNSFVPVFIQVNNGNSANRTDVFGTTTSP
jgi:hypothetical protein